MNRVVVTGLGIVSPIGVGVKHCWNALMNGSCGVVALKGSDFEKLPSKVGALVPEGNSPHAFNREAFSSAQWRQMSKSTAFALLAAEEALVDAAWIPKTDEDCDLTGVAVGTGMVDLLDICDAGNLLANRGHSKISPYFVPRILPNMAAGQISIKYKLCGPNHSVSTACSTGAHSIGDGFTMIQRNQAKVMVCGGTEASVTPLGIAGFCRLRALSTNFNETPQQASRPFDARRDGFVMGEGAGVVILEDLQHALNRKAKIYAEIVGYGLSGDGYHLTSPDKNGRGAFLCMTRALNEANIRDPTDVGYINAHSTSTPQGDEIESRAICRLMLNQVNNLLVSSTKGATGHLLGAAGSVEAIFTILAVQSGQVPPTLNLEKSNIEMGLNYVPNSSVDWPDVAKSGRRIALTNSFGFGGTNVSLCFAAYKM